MNVRGIHEDQRNSGSVWRNPQGSGTNRLWLMYCGVNELAECQEDRVSP